MGATCAKGFGPALRGRNTEDTGENQSIRDEYTDKGYCDDHSNNNKKHQLIDVDAGAGELQEGEDFTQIMVNDVGITEGQFQYASGVGHGPRKPYHIRTKHHQRTDMRRHGDHVQQRIADSHIAILSHRYQHTALRIDKETEEK